MFGNAEESELDLIDLDLEVKETIRLVDHDYTSLTSMINRIKNYTFIRVETGEEAIVPTSLPVLMSARSLE